MIDRPNYYAILPASVRYDQRLRPNAKLLYAEITSLCNANGCCTAQNDYFSELYGVSKKTITELVGQLSASGYIKVEVIRDEKGQVLGRNIFLPAEDTEAADPPPKNRGTSPENSGDLSRKIGAPSPEKSGVYKRRILQERINTPVAPKKGPEESTDCWQRYAGDDGELLQALRDFEALRNRRKKPMVERSKKLLLGRLDKLSRGSREAKIAMLETAILRCWDTVYPLRSEEAPQKPQEGDDEIWE